MKLGIGLLAHDEAAGISRTLESLFEQQGVGAPAGAIERAHVLVVANGCRDETAAVARRCIAERIARAPGRDHHLLPVGPPDPLDDGRCDGWLATVGGRPDPPAPAGTRVTWEVRALARAGKSNAWNHCVHRLIPRSCEALAMLDADIEFGDGTVVRQAVETLRDHPEVWVATDLAVKSSDRGRAWQRRLSTATSELAREEARTAICGQFYCGRMEALRRVVMPPGLAVEDGFLRAMIVTDMFTGPERLERIRQLESAHHFFEPEHGLRATLRHETRLMLGSTVNSYLYDHLWEHASSAGGAGEWIRQRLLEDPEWLDRLVATRIRGTRGWLVPWSLVLNRAQGLGGLPLAAKLRRLPVACAAVAFDLVAACRAQRLLRRDRAVGFW